MSVEQEDGELQPMQDSELQPIPISNEEDLIKEDRGVLIIFPLIIVILVGAFAGIRSHTKRESLIYSSMFGIESLICFIIANFMPVLTYQQSTKKFATFLALMGISCAAAFHIPNDFKKHI